MQYLWFLFKPTNFNNFCTFTIAYNLE